MSDSDKIRISLGEVHSSEVDQKLQQQSVRIRATDHYRQQVGASLPALSGRPHRTNFWYHTAVSLTLFGFLGGICAWIPSEIVWQIRNGPMEARLQFLKEVGVVIQQLNSGEISQREADAQLMNLKVRYRGNRFVAILTDDSLPQAEKDRQLDQLEQQEASRGVITSLIYCAICGMGLALSLSIADAVVGRNLRDAIVNGSVGICLGLLGGILVGSSIDRIYQALGGGDVEQGWAVQVFARAVGWGILGLFLAAGPGLVLKSPKKLLIGLCGGFLGGLIGGGMFDVIGQLTNAVWTSRLVALTAIGSVAGLSTGLIENVVKTGWLKVSSGLIAGKQFILYKSPTLLGSSPQCEIYLFKDPQVAPQHAAIRQTPQGFELEDLHTAGGTFVNGAAVHRVRLRNQDQVQIGGTTFVFQEKSKASS